LLKSLILKFVKNVKSQSGDAAAAASPLIKSFVTSSIFVEHFRHNGSTIGVIQLPFVDLNKAHRAFGMKVLC